MGLNKIGRETGEEEDSNIQYLASLGVLITKEEIVNFSCRHRGFFIIEPF